MHEVWKVIEDCDNHYEVSNLGNVRSSRKILKPYNRHGYLYVRLPISGKYKNVRIHRLVAKSFLPNPMNKPYVNHINGKRDDNRVENLEWVTSSENLKHAYRSGLATNKGENNANSKLTLEQVNEIKVEILNDYHPSEIAKKYNVSICTIVSICKGRSWVDS